MRQSEIGNEFIHEGKEVGVNCIELNKTERMQIHGKMLIDVFVIRLRRILVLLFSIKEIHVSYGELLPNF